jgi:hypothetical protein
LGTVTGVVDKKKKKTVACDLEGGERMVKEGDVWFRFRLLVREERERERELPAREV